MNEDTRDFEVMLPSIKDVYNQHYNHSSSSWGVSASEALAFVTSSGTRNSIHIPIQTQWATVKYSVRFQHAICYLPFAILFENVLNVLVRPTTIDCTWRTVPVLCGRCDIQSKNQTTQLKCQWELWWLKPSLNLSAKRSTNHFVNQYRQNVKQSHIAVNRQVRKLSSQPVRSSSLSRQKEDCSFVKSLSVPQSVRHQLAAAIISGVTAHLAVLAARQTRGRI